MVEKKKLSDQELDGLLASAAADRPVLSDALTNRVLADADSILASQYHRTPYPPRRARFASIFRAIGGWPGVGGLATATVAGVWMGFAQPVGLGELTDFYMADTTYDLEDFMPSINGFLYEG